MPKLLYKSFCGLILMLSATVSFGQVATGSFPYGTYAANGPDTIDLGNLNVQFSIPVLQKSERGTPFHYSLIYDSSIWYPTNVSGSMTWVPVQNLGLGDDTEIATGYMTYNVSTFYNPGPNEDCYETINSNFSYHDPSGVTHLFGSFTTSGCPNPKSAFTSTATDGSGYSLAVANYTVSTITSAFGTVITVPNKFNGPGTITDSNGNKTSTDGNGNLTDTTGKVILTVAGTAPNPHTFSYKDTTGKMQSVSVTYKTYNLQTAFGCSGVAEYGPTSTSLIDTITLPDLRVYTFSYEPTPGVTGNVTGRLAGLELPQGGTISYSYTGGSNGIVCADGSASGLTRKLSSDSGSASSTSTYVRTPGTGTSHTEVVDGLGYQKAYDFVIPTGSSSYLETNRNIYQGSESTTAVVAQQTCYNNTAAPCTTTAITPPISQIDTYETLDGIQTTGSTVKLSAYGAETEKDVYGFDGSSRGSLLSKEVWTYAGPYPALPTADQVYDQTGSTLVGETTYAYDGSAVVASSGVPQHVAPTGARGNLTLETVYASSSQTYPLSATYEDTGSLLTSVSPTGTTTLSYDSTFVYTDGTALPTPSSKIAIGLVESYDTANTGLPLTSNDPNNQTTTFKTYDSMLRLTEIDYPNSGKTTVKYENPNQTGTLQYQTASVSSDTEVLSDSYGRLSQTAVANGQSGNNWYQQDTCYDGNGNLSFLSYSYQGAGFGPSKVCSGAGDAYTYDVLGRVTKILRGDGETVIYSYKGRATQTTDENGVIKINQHDGLGRPTIVCEISSNSSMPGNSGSPVSCGTDIAGTGFTTTYAYALATGTTTVSQGGQTRTFQNDWLGRPILVTEPESGTTTYSYAYNSTGLVVTRKKPTANQTSSTVLTTTTTQYDSLNRVTSTSYTDGTPTKTFAYDASAGWSDLSQVNLKGRLSIAYVPGAASVYSYGSMGKVGYLDECLPSGCASPASSNPTTDRQQHFVYDYDGNLTSSSDGAGVTTTYTVTVANELETMTSSLNNSTNPPSLISSMASGPNGPISYTLANGLSQYLGYDSLGRANSGWVCTGVPSAACSSQIYGYAIIQKGSQVQTVSDNIMGQHMTYGYDEFNRLTSWANGSGQSLYTYGYDRWGNRWSQSPHQGGSTSALSFNTATNQINQTGYLYDAAGNMTQDGGTGAGFHTYTYDAEGNITKVDGGSTAQYTYDALNQRVKTLVGSVNTEFVFNAAGQRVSVWNGSTKTAIRGEYYWGATPVAYYIPGSAVHFQHQDWLGTERLRTTYNETTEGTYSSLPFGDGYALGNGSTDADPYHFAALDSDSESETDHATYRQYSSAQGRWMRPDPYSGSYDPLNPQSMNRYSYVLNNPLIFVDQAGLDDDGCPDGETCIYGGDPTDPPDNPDPGLPGNENGGGNTQNGEPVAAFIANTWLCDASCPNLDQYFELTALLSFDIAPNNQPANNPCPAGTTPHTQRMLVTGYDNSFQSTRKNPGDPHYGQTTSGAMAGPGTIAAPRTYSFGTQMFIPGYGLGTVLDRGGAIRNSHIDLWFPSTQQAINWGAQHLQVTVCR